MTAPVPRLRSDLVGRRDECRKLKCIDRVVTGSIDPRLSKGADLGADTVEGHLEVVRPGRAHERQRTMHQNEIFL